MVFQELAPSQAHKIKNRSDLETELFGSSESSALLGVRDNEGEAAEHGIYFDDTEYDYMQHIKDINAGSGNGDSYFVEAVTKRNDGKGKGKVSLEEALRGASLQEERSASPASHNGGSQFFDDDLLPSKDLRKSTYQDQQDVPDALAGFQPDMDPRLREVLEALEDEAYVDDEEDVFGELAKDGREVSLEEFEEADFEHAGDEAGWETDETEKPNKEYKNGDMLPPPVPPSSADITMEDLPDHGDGDWMEEFSKFKQADKAANKAKPQASNAELQSSIMTGTSMTGGRRKKRKGAMTSSTGYSMTSSSIFRTEGQTLLDARFDKIEENYAEDEMDLDDGGASILTGSSMASSQAPSLVQRSDFDSIMDEFLGGYSMSGKKRVKKGGYQSGMEQLDEVRKGLGPARIKPQKV